MGRLTGRLRRVAFTWVSLLGVQLSVSCADVPPIEGAAYEPEPQLEKANTDDSGCDEGREWMRVSGAYFARLKCNNRSDGEGETCRNRFAGGRRGFPFWYRPCPEGWTRASKADQGWVQNRDWDERECSYCYLDGKRCP